NCRARSVNLFASSTAFRAAARARAHGRMEQIDRSGPAVRAEAFPGCGSGASDAAGRPRCRRTPSAPAPALVAGSRGPGEEGRAAATPADPPGGAVPKDRGTLAAVDRKGDERQSRSTDRRGDPRSREGAL